MKMESMEWHNGFLTGKVPAVYHLKYSNDEGTILLIDKNCAHEMLDDSFVLFQREGIKPSTLIRRVPDMDEYGFEAFCLELVPLQTTAGTPAKNRPAISALLCYLFGQLNLKCREKSLGSQSLKASQHLFLDFGMVEGLSFSFIGGMISYPFRDWLFQSGLQHVSSAEQSMFKVGRFLSRRNLDCSACIGREARGLTLSVSNRLSGTMLGLSAHFGEGYQLDPGNMNNMIDQLTILAGFSAIYAEFRNSL